VKKPLTHCDIAEGKKYEVIKRPEHLNGVHYPWLNMVGVCKWSNAYNGVLMSFGGCKERLIPHDCLEAVEETPTIQTDEQSPIMDEYGTDALILFYKNQAEKEKKENNSVIPENVKLDGLYRIVRIPPWWTENAVSVPYPSLGQIGRLIKTTTNHVTLKMGDGKQRFVPFTCLEAVNVIIPPSPSLPVMDLSDDKLIDAIIANPVGCLKIVRGLAKMNKDPRAVAFVQRGMLF